MGACLPQTRWESVRSNYLAEGRVSRSRFPSNHSVATNLPRGNQIIIQEATGNQPQLIDQIIWHRICLVMSSTKHKEDL